MKYVFASLCGACFYGLLSALTHSDWSWLVWPAVVAGFAALDTIILEAARR